MLDIIAIPNRIVFRRLFYNFCCRSASFMNMHTIPTTSDCALDVQKSSVIGPIGHPIASPTEQSTVISPAAEGKANEASYAKMKQFPIPPARELCCGVWIQFADEVMQYVKNIPLHDGVADQQKRIVNEALKQNVEDDNLRVYLLMEIQAKGF